MCNGYIYMKYYGVKKKATFKLLMSGTIFTVGQGMEWRRLTWVVVPGYGHATEWATTHTGPSPHVVGRHVGWSLGAVLLIAALLLCPRHTTRQRMAILQLVLEIDIKQ